MDLRAWLAGDSQAAQAVAAELGELKFRRWYERQLIKGHAWLVTGFLCLIVLTVGIEMLTAQGFAAHKADRFIGFLLSVGGAVVTFYSWLRYQRLLAFAERVAAQAVCPQCQKVGCTPADARAPVYLSIMTAQCRACQHCWPVNLNAQDLPGR